jgi:16S rRNA (uracil1498-N3)-methyltransferase
MLPRFCAPSLNGDLLRLDLPADEARHLAKVLRVREGDAVLVFNGRGLQRRGTVSAIHGSRVSLELDDVAPAAPELSVHVTLAQAILKGDSMDQVIRDATTIGVRTIVPLITSRVELRQPAERASGRLDRWRRIAMSATKQCGRAVLPQVQEPQSFENAMEGGDAFTCVMLVEPLAEAGLTMLDELTTAAPASRIAVFVGPEGGWTPEEIAAGRDAGAALVSLGGRTLRAETVAIAGLPVVLHAMSAWP